jgi:hypothetical protein
MDISGGDRESLQKEKNIMLTPMFKLRAGDGGENLAMRRRGYVPPVKKITNLKTAHTMRTPFLGFRVDETDLNGNSVRFVGAFDDKDEADAAIPRNKGGFPYGVVKVCTLIAVDGQFFVLADGTAKVLS